jgi:aspartyl-tRNA(Asn)/glutamyl-tRNA(Gln) amidotransferase subunit C
MSEKITQEEVRHVAKLARLELSEADEVALTGQMNKILSYMDTLNQLDTSEVPPTTHAIQQQNVFRVDEVQPSLDRASSLANAPETDRVSFVVPKVI